MLLSWPLLKGNGVPLKAQKIRAEKQLRDLNATVETLRTSQGSLSERESMLQSALETEKRRHEADVAALETELDEAAEQAQDQQKALNDTKTALSAKEQELSAAHHRQQELEEKLQSLEDEIEVLQSGFDNNHQVQDNVSTARKEADGLRRQVKSLQQDVAPVSDGP